MSYFLYQINPATNENHAEQARLALGFGTTTSIDQIKSIFTSTAADAPYYIHTATVTAGSLNEAISALNNVQSTLVTPARGQEREDIRSLLPGDILKPPKQRIAYVFSGAGFERLDLTG